MYTDDYDENENVSENEESKETYKEPKKSTNYLRIIIIFILIIVLLGLLYFVFKDKIGSKTPDAYTLNVYPESIVIPVGKDQNVSYEVRKNGVIVPDATVRLTIIDESIASVDNTLVTGLKYGKTMIMATYINPDGKSFQETKDLIVADGDPDVKITDVTFPDGDLQMSFNGTYNINLGINPPNGFVENKVITSSNPNVVMVDDNGLVTAISEGNAVITIDINNGQFRKDVMVYVSRDSEISKLVVSPTGISITNPVTKMKVGDTEVVKYSISPSNASTDNTTWSSSNENIVSIDYRGKMTALKEGSATIKVQTFNNISDSFTVLVEKKETEVVDIILSVTQLDMTVGSSQMIIPSIDPFDATDKTLSYSVDNPTIVLITPSPDTSSVTITPLQAGTAVLTISANNGKLTKTLNIMVIGATPTPSSGGSGGSGGSSCASCSKTSCGSGQYCSCGKCLSCPAGNYCYNNKKTACPAGKGSIANSSSYQDCSDCAKGYYSTGDGKGCVACPVGKTTKSSGSTSKNDCSVDETGTCKSNEYFDGTKCAACPSGYTNSGGATSISSCKITVSAGQYVKNSGASKTTACPTGTYSTVTTVQYGNTSACTPCAKGYYQDKTGQSSCTKCPSGKTTEGTGSKSSSACSVTVTTCYKYQYLVNGVCRDCPDGYKCDGKDRTKCPAGTISVAKSSTCSNCSTGKSNDARTQCIR